MRFEVVQDSVDDIACVLEDDLFFKDISREELEKALSLGQLPVNEECHVTDAVNEAITKVLQINIESQTVLEYMRSMNRRGKNEGI